VIVEAVAVPMRSMMRLRGRRPHKRLKHQTVASTHALRAIRVHEPEKPISSMNPPTHQATLARKAFGQPSNLAAFRDFVIWKRRYPSP
jgi:hypothetical protein